jgi:hypothetical protein
LGQDLAQQLDGIERLGEIGGSQRAKQDDLCRRL